jgi:hypothetical protein
MAGEHLRYVRRAASVKKKLLLRVRGPLQGVLGEELRHRLRQHDGAVAVLGLAQADHRAAVALIAQRLAG